MICFVKFAINFITVIDLIYPQDGESDLGTLLATVGGIVANLSVSLLH